MAQAPKSPPEGRVTLRNVGWETYKMLVDEDPDRSAPLFFYEVEAPNRQAQARTRLALASSATRRVAGRCGATRATSPAATPSS